MKKWLLVVLLLFITSTAFALTQNQENNLSLAYTVGAEYGWPETAQVIILQESSAGKDTRFGDNTQTPERRSYGIAHMTLGTAKDVLRRHFGHNVYKNNDDALIIELVTNDKFAIHMMMWYFTYLVDKFEGNWNKALLAYNVGPGNVRKYGLSFDPNDHLKKCIYRLKNEVRPFNLDSNSRGYKIN